jgi:PIN domain nuclease of toxin-antitoxin system
VRYLLDTCTLIWAALSPSALTSTTRAIIADPANEILVSAASAWEISTKIRLGKLPGVEPLERNFIELIARAGYKQLPIDVEMALRAGRLPGNHRDPFNRIIAAQSIALDAPVLTPDTQFDGLTVRRIWS